MATEVQRSSNASPSRPLRRVAPEGATEGGSAGTSRRRPRRLSAQARVSPISKGAVLAPAPGTPSTPGRGGSVGASADGEHDEVAMELAATRTGARRHGRGAEGSAVGDGDVAEGDRQTKGDGD